MTGYLLDTHALIWWMSSSPQLAAPAKAAIENGGGSVFASAVSAYEIALKHTAGKLDIAANLLLAYEADLSAVGLRELPITSQHALAAGQLDLLHRDPFDRLLIAQAKLEGLTLISNERLFDRFGVARLWD